MRNWINLVEGISGYSQELLDRIPEGGSLKVNLDGSVLSSIRALEAEGLIDAKINSAAFQATLTRKVKPVEQPRADISTPAFKQWFGKSHVVDQHGDPLIVYHGTGSEFDAFDPESEPLNYETDRGKFFFTSDKDIAGEYAKGDAWGADNANPRVIHAYVSMQNPYVIDNSDEPIQEWDQYGDQYAKEAAAGGHDGIIIHTEDGSERLVVALSPSQIKSVDNHGTFNPGDPRMRH